MANSPNKYSEKQKDIDFKLTSYKQDSLLNKIRRHFRSYCNHTSIHGFQYLGQNRTLIEKCWWVVVFIGIVSSCGFTIYLIYNKWQTSPVIVSLTTRDTPIYQVPFPAVTICPTIKFSFEFLNSHKIFSQESVEFRTKLFRYVLTLCKRELRMGYEGPPESLNETYIDNDIYSAFLKCSPYRGNWRFNSNQATFMGEDLDFDEDINPIMTDDGLCLTFNMLSTADIYTNITYVHPGFSTSGPKSYWIPQLGYANEAELLTFPRRALLSGAINSLEMRLFHKTQDIDYKCTGSEQGYKVILHLPTRVPRPTLEYIMVPFGKASIIAVNPVMMTTSKVVKQYASDKRDCYFPEEKKLKFFKIYSGTNCQFECLTNYTLKECQCVAFYMPREASTPLCGITKFECVEIARKKYNLSKLKAKLHDDFLKFKDSRTSVFSASAPSPDSVENNSTGNSTSGSRKKRQEEPLMEDMNDVDDDEDDARCQCLKTCSDITYKGSATNMEFDWRQVHGLSLNQSKAFDFTQITIFLDTNSVFTTERNELYGPTDFLSNFGGLLGLFTGFSFLSLMEIIYFCSLRIFGNRKLLGRWYGDKDD